MNSIVDDMRTLIDGTNGLVFGTNLYIGKEPAEPDNSVTLFDTNPSMSQLDLSGSSKYEDGSFQIRVRNVQYVQAYTLAYSLMTTLHGISNQIINTTHYNLILAITIPTVLDYDAKNRVRVIINFKIQRHE